MRLHAFEVHVRRHPSPDLGRQDAPVVLQDARVDARDGLAEMPAEDRRKPVRSLGRRRQTHPHACREASHHSAPRRRGDVVRFVGDDQPEPLAPLMHAPPSPPGERLERRDHDPSLVSRFALLTLAVAHEPGLHSARVAEPVNPLRREVSRVHEHEGRRVVPRHESAPDHSLARSTRSLDNPTAGLHDRIGRGALVAPERPPERYGLGGRCNGPRGALDAFSATRDPHTARPRSAVHCSAGCDRVRRLLALAVPHPRNVRRVGEREPTTPRGRLGISRTQEQSSADRAGHAGRPNSSACGSRSPVIDSGSTSAGLGGLSVRLHRSLIPVG